MIRIETLVKKFQHKDKEKKTAWKTAVDGLSFSIKKGEVFGLLGPNGAGKTTTIRMLTMLTEPTSGAIYYDGQELKGHEKEMKRLIGVVPQHVNFDQDLTVGENLELHARLHHMGSRERRERIAELLEYVELTDSINDNVRRLSGGMKRRLLIARALIHRPKILFLDEPTVALDPQVRRRIWDLIRQMARNDVTILLTTHYIEEAEALCSRVVILNEGRCIADGAPQELCRRVGPYVVEWQENGKSNFQFFHEREEAADYTSALANDTVLRQANLEDVFVQLTGRKVAG